MNTKKTILFILILVMGFALFSCKDTPAPQDSDNTEDKTEEVLSLNIYAFNNEKPKQVLDESVVYSDYEGGEDIREQYSLKLYKELKSFSETYPDLEFEKAVFEVEDKYDSFSAPVMYKNYMYFHTEKDGVVSIRRYNFDNGQEEIIYQETTENQIAIKGISDKYLVWSEDENANWLKAHLNYLNMETGESALFYTFARDENDFMYSWNFEKVIIENDDVYFQDTVSINDGTANVNLYKYNIAEDTLVTVFENRGAQPMNYKGISFISYDDTQGEYILKNINSEKPNVYLGNKLSFLSASNNTLVAKSDDCIILYKNNTSQPIIKSSTTIDTVSCTDSFIAWDGWNHNPPIYFDIERNILVRLDFLNDKKRYVGYVSEDYLVFKAHEYVPDEKQGAGAITTKAYNYYYIKTELLKNKD